MLNNSLLFRLLKKVRMQGGARGEARGVLSTYAAAPRERVNAADGPFSAACWVHLAGIAKGRCRVRPRSPFGRRFHAAQARPLWLPSY